MNFVKKSHSSFLSPELHKLIKKHFQALIVGGIFVTLLVGTFIAVLLSQKEQEIRQQASTPTGQILMNFTTNPTPVVAGQPVEIIFNANTASLNVTGFQFVGTLSGSTASMLTTAPTVEVLNPSQLKLFAAPSITANGDGSYDFGFAVTPLSATDTYTSSSFQGIAKIIITPQETGTVNLSFDTAGSKSEIVVNGDIIDELRIIDPVQFTVVEQSSTATPTNTPIAEATATFTPTVTMCAMPTQPLCQTGQTVVCNDNAPGSAVCMTCTCQDVATDPTPTSTPTFTGTRQCNQSCSFPGDPCVSGLTCFNNVCRLASSPDDITCGTGQPTPTPTVTPDNGGTGGTTVRYCGETCSAHADCAVNLMCYNGTCRLANNPTDLYCNEPADQGIHRTCNEYCADSRECQNGLTCYYNRCRNPRNLTDSYCSNPIAYTSPRPTSTVRYITATPEPTSLPTATPQPQGGDNTGGIVRPTATRVLATNSPWPTYAPIATLTPAPEDEFTLAERIQSFIKGLLVIALVISAIFLLLWLLPLFFKRRRKDDDDDMPPMATPTGTGTSPYSDSLHKKTSGDL